MSVAVTSILGDVEVQPRRCAEHDDHKKWRRTPTSRLGAELVTCAVCGAFVGWFGWERVIAGNVALYLDGQQGGRS